MPIKISVVIPTYRRPHLLAGCLQALGQQSVAADDYEVIVVSDGPDAATQSALAAQPPPIKHFHFLATAQKGGPAAARNLGWQQAQGALIAFTDDDCLPDSNWLHGFLKAYNRAPDAVYTGRVKVPLSQPPTDYEKNTAGLETADFVTANCCCTKTALQKVGGFDEQFSMAWREDSDLEFRLLKKGIPIYYKVEALVVHPVRQAPWGISIKEQKKSMFNALLYKKYPDLYRQKIQRHPRWDYYVMILSFLLLLTGIAIKAIGLSIAALACWLLLVITFMLKRLSATSKKRSHILEMIVTSVIIPFAAIYWRLYGAVKYKVLFL